MTTTTNNKNNNKTKDDVGMTTSNKKFTKRAGVGSTIASMNDASSQNIPQLQSFLRVGQKQRKHGTNQDDDSDDNDIGHASGLNDPHDDEEEEEENEDGRTAINDAKRIRIDVASQLTIPPVQGNKKKKKKGKKERQQEIVLGIDSVPESSSEINNDQNNTRATNTPLETTTTTTTSLSTITPPLLNPQNPIKDDKRRHRPKVRSRQKNIYKDKRSMDQKPMHLIVGSQDFSGRPMTPETRAKLNLPTKERHGPRLMQQQQQRRRRRRSFESWDSDPLETSRNYNDDYDAGGLAIDDWLVPNGESLNPQTTDSTTHHDNDNDNDAEQQLHKKNKSHKSSTNPKRKPKYKNLMCN